MMAFLCNHLLLIYAEKSSTGFVGTIPKPVDFYCETQILMRLQYDKRSAVRLVSRIIPHAKQCGTILQVEQSRHKRRVMRPKLQKQRVLKLVGRIILPKHGYKTPPLRAELWSMACLGVHTRDSGCLKYCPKEYIHYKITRQDFS